MSGFQYIVPAAQSAVLRKVLVNGSSTSQAWLIGQPTWQSPVTLTEDPQNGKDGVLGFGVSGAATAARLLVVPYAKGSPGQKFSLRVFGEEYVSEDPVQQVGLPLLLVELVCTLANLPGPQTPLPGPPTRAILDSEYFCDTIAVTRGTVGPSGEVVSTAAGLVAFAAVETRGAKRLWFDFKQTDPVAMNALWKRL